MTICKWFCEAIYLANFARKTMFSFSKYSEKIGFSKKLRWNMICLVLSGKMIFLFPENIIVFFRRKMQDDLSQKKYMEIWYFLQMSQKDGFSKKKNHSGIWSFLYYLERWYFFPPENMIFFLWTENERWSFSRNTWKYDIFVYMYKCYKYDITLLQKKSKMIFSQKNTLKGDWHSRLHSRKSSNDSLYFYGDLHRRFHILLSSEKNQET